MFDLMAVKLKGKLPGDLTCRYTGGEAGPSGMGRWKLSSSPHKRVSSSAHTVVWGTETPFHPLLLSRPQREGCPPRGHLTVIHRPQRLCPGHGQWRLYVPSVDNSAFPRCAALTQWQQGTWHEAPSKKQIKKQWQNLAATLQGHIYTQTPYRKHKCLLFSRIIRRWPHGLQFEYMIHLCPTNRNSRKFKMLAKL